MSEATPVDTAPRVSSRFWYVIDVCLVAFLFVYANVLPLTSYLGGLRNDFVYGFGLAVDWFLLLPVAFASLVFLAVRMAVSWPKHIRSPKKLRAARLLAIAGLGLCLVLFFWPTWEPGYKTYTIGLKKYLQANADIPGIRAWISTVDPNTCTGKVVRIRELDEKQKAQWPQPVMSLNPESVILCLDRNKYPAIRLGWSTLDAFWGVEIGPADMEIPSTLPPQPVQVGGSTMVEHGEYRLAVGPGIYVWHETE
jgi:hypothetical protein